MPKKTATLRRPGYLFSLVIYWRFGVLSLSQVGPRRHGNRSAGRKPIRTVGQNATETGSIAEPASLRRVYRHGRDGGQRDRQRGDCHEYGALGALEMGHKVTSSFHFRYRSEWSTSDQ